jgi:hypothetical protein
MEGRGKVTKRKETEKKKVLSGENEGGKKGESRKAKITIIIIIIGFIWLSNILAQS